MDVQIRASVDLYGSALRYAEVEHYGTRRRLIRLGNCNFDFDAESHVFGDVNDPQLTPLSEALEDVFSSFTAQSLQIVVHPSAVLAFSSPVRHGQDELSLRQQLRTEADLLSEVDGTSGSTLVVNEVAGRRTDGHQEPWCHCAVIPPAVARRWEQIVSSLNPPEINYHSSAFSVLPAVEGLSSRSETAEEAAASNDSKGPVKDVVALVGWYEEHLEITLLRHEEVILSQHRPASDPADSAYLMLHLMEQAEVKANRLRDILVYGNAPDMRPFQLFHAATGVAPRQVNPIALIDLEPGSLVDGFDASDYAPAIGAVL